MTRGIMHTRKQLGKHLFGAIGLLLLLLMGLQGGAGAITTNFAYSSTTMPQGGYWTSGSFGHNYWIASGQNSQIDFVFTGSGLTAQLKYNTGAAANIGVSIDGAAESVVSVANTWGFVTLASGLADGAHTCTLRLDQGGQTNNLQLDSDNFLQVTGAAPAVSLPSGFGPQYTPTSSAWTSNVSSEGFPALVSIGGYSNILSNTGNGYCDMFIRFYAKTDRIVLWMSQRGGTYEVSRDGTIIATLTATNTGGNFGYVTFATGLDASTTHEYQVALRNEGGYTYTPAFLMLTGAGLQTHTYTPRTPVQVFVGDSITAGDSVSADPLTLNSRQGYVYKVSAGANTQAWNRGIAGNRAADVVSRIAADVAAANGLTPAKIWVLIGTNDIGPSTGSPNTAVGTYQSSYTTLLNNALASNTTAQIKCLAILPRQDANNSYVASYNSAITAAIAACNAPARVAYVSTAGWINTTTDIVSASVHPSDAGYTKIANRIIAILNPAALFRSRSSGGPRAGSRSAD